MDPRLGRISLEVTAMQRACANPPADLSEKITALDTKIKDFVRRNAWASDLEAQWESFKADIYPLIAISQETEAMEESNGAVKAAWDLFQKEHEGLELVDRVKDFISSRIAPLQGAIGSAVSHLTPARAASRPPRTQEAREAAAIRASEAQERALLLQKRKEQHFRDHPNIVRALHFLAVGLESGAYGKKIKDAFSNLDSSVISSASLLKFLIIENSKHAPIPHLMSELEWTEETPSEADKIKGPIEGVSAEIIEEIFLKELSPESEGVSRLLNDAVRGIRITREEDQNYVSLLHSMCDAMHSYEKALEGVQAVENIDDRIRILEEVILRFKSLDPEGFFAAIDKILRELDGASRGIDPELLHCISTEIEKNPHILISLRRDAYLLKYLDFMTSTNPSTLLVPRLLQDQERAFTLINEILALPEEERNFTLPVELFQFLMNASPDLAFEVARHVELRDRFQCIVQLMHLPEELRPKPLDHLANQCLFQAHNYLEKVLLEYSDEPTQQQAEKAKSDMRQLLRYLTAEIGEFLPEEIKEDHLEGSSEQQIEYALLKDFLSPLESASSPEKVKRDRIKISLIPELARIGKKDEAIEIATEELDRINDQEDLKKLREQLMTSLLKASGLPESELDEHFGVLLESPNPEFISLDSDFTEIYLNAVMTIKDPVMSAERFIDGSARAGAIFAQFKEESYKKFASESAEHAFESIRGMEPEADVEIMVKITSSEDSLFLLNVFIQKLNFLEPRRLQEVEEYRKKVQNQIHRYRIKSLKTNLDPTYQISCRIRLFQEYRSLQKDKEAIQIAREALDLRPPLLIDPVTQVITGPFVDLLLNALVQLHAVSTRTENGKRLQIESEIKQFMLKALRSIEDAEYCTRLSVQVVKNLKPPSDEFFSEAANISLEKIQSLIASQEETLISWKVQRDVLVQLIFGFQGKAQTSMTTAKALLSGVLQKLFTARLDVDLAEKMRFLESLIYEFGMVGDSDKVAFLVDERLSLTTPENFREQLRSFDDLSNWLSRYIKSSYDIRAERRLLEPTTIELTLVDLFLKMIRSIPNLSIRIQNFGRLPANLKEVGYLEDSPLYKEFSRRALTLAVEQVKGGRGRLEDQIRYIERAIEIATPIDPELADSFREELNQLGQQDRPDLKRKREDEEGPL